MACFRSSLGTSRGVRRDSASRRNSGKSDKGLRRKQRCYLHSLLRIETGEQRAALVLISRSCNANIITAQEIIELRIAAAKLHAQLFLAHLLGFRCFFFECRGEGEHVGRNGGQDLFALIGLQRIQNLGALLGSPIHDLAKLIR